MANYQQLKNALVDVIKHNGNNEITGEIMQTTLLSMINGLGANYQFAGILTPSTSFVPTDENIFYIGGAGSYSNFGATTINVPTGCICIFTYNGSFASSILYVGGVVDISKLTNTSYASLSQALADVPSFLQVVSGLEIMYQDSTSGNYVKYRLMATSWSTTVSNWQGVDDEPTAGSKNLVKSGGVAKETHFVEFSELQNYLPIDKNFTDAIITSVPSNYQIEFISRTSVKITHPNSFTNGSPEVYISELNTGTYIVTYATNIAISVGFYVDSTYSKMLESGDEIRIESGHTYYLILSIPSNSVCILNNLFIRNADNTLEQCEERSIYNSGSIVQLENGVKNIVSVFQSLSGEEMQPDEIMTGYILHGDTGLPDAYPAVPEYELKKYSISAGDIIKILANANYANYMFSILDADGNKIDGQRSAQGATYTRMDDAIIVPKGGVTLYVAYNTTIFDGIAYSDLQLTVNKNTLFGKKWACIGDSLTEVNSRTTKHYYDYVSEETGVIPLNYGLSGTGYARRRDENIAFYQRISAIDLSCDIVTIFGSFNDLGAISADFPIGNVNDNGIVSIAGCINQALDNLFQIKPVARLGIVAPTPWSSTQPGTFSPADNYVSLLQDICKHRSIPFLDLYHHSNLRPWDATFRQLAYSKDGDSGVHPDEIGHSLFAPMIRSFIQSLI